MVITDKSFLFLSQEIQNKVFITETAAQDIIKDLDCPDPLSAWSVIIQIGIAEIELIWSNSKMWLAI